MGWSTSDMPPQPGKVALVTGATDGLGREIATALALHGASVIVAGRDRGRGEAVAGALGNGASFEPVDLASLAAVRDFAGRVSARHPRIDILVANAGLSMPQSLQRSADGFELQFGVNFLSHFLLTSLLMPVLIPAGARIVTMSSLAAPRGKVDVTDLNAERGYSPMRSYALSKLAMILFAREMQARSIRRGWGIKAVAAHPGFSRTNLGKAGPRIGGGARLNHVGLSMAILGPIIGQSPAEGALPALYAATVEGVPGGAYIGPGGWGGLKGPPKVVPLPASADSTSDGNTLWKAANRLTGAAWPG